MEEREEEMSFLDHLEELRWRIMRSAIAIAIGAIVIFVMKDFVFDTIIFGPRRLDFASFRAWCSLSEWVGLGDKLCVTEIKYEVISTTMLGQFTAHLVVSIVGGIIIAFPYIFFEFWSFIKPGLKTNEQKSVRGISFFTSFLFFSGIVFGYFVIVPLSLQFLGSYQVGDVVSRISVMSYMKTIVSIVLAAGIIFQLPILVYFLAKIGLVSASMLRKYRRHALVGVLILAAVITPPDITSQILVSMPVLLLYEISILIAKRIEKSKTT
jgi:sec-independent protein translocase protein TatC